MGLKVRLLHPASSLFCLLLLILAAVGSSGSVAAQQVPAAAGAAGAAAGSDPPGELVLAQVVFRHGARTPLSNAYWPDAPWTHCSIAHLGSINISLYDADGGPKPPPIPDAGTTPILPGGCRMGMLTNNGYNMALQLGRRLRERYIVRHRLLPPRYGVPASGRSFPASASTPLLAETTASQRTVLTLQGVLSGLYPAGFVAKGVAVPVACRKAAQEIMVGGNATCPVLPLLIAPMQALQDEQVSRDPQLQRLAARVHSELQLPAGTPVSWGRLRDTLACMAAEGKLPPGALQLLPLIDTIATKLKLEVAFPDPAVCLTTQPACQQVLRLTIGQLLQDMYSHMQAAAAAAAGPAAGGVKDDTRKHIVNAGSAALQAAHAWRRQQQQQQQLKGNSNKLQHKRLRLTPTSSSSGHWRWQWRRQQQQQEPAGSRQTAPRVVLYSAHDITLMPLLAARGQQQRHWPTFTSSLAFELWRHGRSHYVRVLHDWQPLPLLLPLQRKHSAPDAGGRHSGNSSSNGSSSSSRQWVLLEEFREAVVDVYGIGSRSHDEACQVAAAAAAAGVAFWL